MKEQIEEILKTQLHFPISYPNDVIGDIVDASEELQQLMCYREVRAYYLCLITYCSAKELSGWEKELIESFVKYYPETMITAAIERVKSE